jgi:hypothetical protein
VPNNPDVVDELSPSVDASDPGMTIVLAEDGSAIEHTTTSSPAAVRHGAEKLWKEETIRRKV